MRKNLLKYKSDSKSARMKQKGATLIELMVSVFIFAIGVLGFASLQSRSIQATFDNGQRDQVVWLTQSLVDRIRVNSSVAAVSNYATLLTDFDAADCATPATLCNAATCTAVEMSTFDVWDLYCSNQFLGTSAIKDLSANLSCTDGTCDTVAENLLLTSTWCARSVESEQALSAGTVCDNTVAQMTYNMGFRP